MVLELFNGLIASLTPSNFIVLLIGVIVGIIVGALPGLTASIAIVILLPFTYAMDPIPALIMLGASYCGSMYGGSISSILINTPGTPAAAMTAVDGFPMARKGKAGTALGMAAFASWFGGTFSVFALLLFSQTLAKFAMKFGPPEFFLLSVFGLTIIVTLSKEDPLKGAISAILGLLFGTVGMDLFFGYKRFTFGSLDLMTGMTLVPVLIGLLSIPHILNLAGESSSTIQLKEADIEDRIIPRRSEVKRLLPTLLRSSLIGTFIGALPGAGGSIATFIAFDDAKRFQAS